MDCCCRDKYNRTHSGVGGRGKRGGEDWTAWQINVMWIPFFVWCIHILWVCIFHRLLQKWNSFYLIHELLQIHVFAQKKKKQWIMGFLLLGKFIHQDLHSRAIFFFRSFFLSACLFSGTVASIFHIWPERWSHGKFIRFHNRQEQTVCSRALAQLRNTV